MSEFKFDIDEEVNNIVFNIMARKGMFNTDGLDIDVAFEQFNIERKESGLAPVTFDEFLELTNQGYDEDIAEIEDVEIESGDYDGLNYIDDYDLDDNAVCIGDFSDSDDGIKKIVENNVIISDEDLNLDDLS